MNHASLFSGIGGPEIAAVMLGWENVFHCEINEFGRKILEYWFPNSQSYEDIKTTNFKQWRGKVDVLTGGFPCQPFSYAGQRRGADDDRYLWPQMLRAIDEIRPAWVVGENVAGIVSMVEQGEVSHLASQATLFDEGDGVQRYRQEQTFTIERVCRDLEGLGYSVQPVLVPACAVGAPHRRDRVFIIGRRIASNTDLRADRRAAGEDAGESGTQRLQERNEVRKPDEPNQVRPTGTAIPEDTMHGRQLYRPNEEQGSERHIGDAGARDCQRICREASRTSSADTACCGSSAQGKDTGFEGKECIIPQQGEWREPSEWSARFYELLRHVANPASRGRNELHQHLEPEQPNGSEPFSDGWQRDASDTTEQCGERMRPEQSETCRAEEVEFGRRSCEGNCEYQLGDRWRGFPTVSPVHRGNDGLPFDVDDLAIPFSKWRTESLKAYGNAIVPQVMYEIFRAIQIIENQLNKC